MWFKHSIQAALRLLKHLIPVPLRLLALRVKSYIHYPPHPFCDGGVTLRSPLISCICITRARPELLARSINCFRMQTWTNKELVILYEDDDCKTREYLTNIRDSNIRILRVKANPKIPLGELRNIGIRASEGSLFCQWDDDDWHHPERLAAQYAYLRGNRADACLLNHLLVYDSKTGAAYISPEWNWDGSILCKKQVFSRTRRYGNLAKGEDTVFINRLNKSCRIALLNRPCLYIYVYHGGNTWNRDHWDANIFTSKSYRLGDCFSLKVHDILANHVSQEIAVRMLRSIHMISLVQCRK